MPKKFFLMLQKWISKDLEIFFSKIAGSFFSMPFFCISRRGFAYQAKSKYSKISYTCIMPAKIAKKVAFPCRLVKIR
jgi:hypothetical protein